MTKRGAGNKKRGKLVWLLAERSLFANVNTVYHMAGALSTQFAAARMQ